MRKRFRVTHPGSLARRRSFGAPSLLRSFDAFVKQHVRAVGPVEALAAGARERLVLLLAVDGAQRRGVHLVGPPERVRLQVGDVVRLDAAVVERVPPGPRVRLVAEIDGDPGRKRALADVRVVVPRERRARVHDDADEAVLEFLRVRRGLVRLVGVGIGVRHESGVPGVVWNLRVEPVQLLERLDREGRHVQRLGELEPGLDLVPLHGLVVELESLQVHAQRVRERVAAEARALHRVAFRAARLARPLVVRLQELAADVRRERLLQALFAAHLHGDVREVLHALRAMRARLADHLVHEHAAHRRLHRASRFSFFVRVSRVSGDGDGFRVLGVHLVLQPPEELQPVLVLAHVHGLAVVVLERAPEPARREVRQPAQRERRERRAQLLQHRVLARRGRDGRGEDRVTERRRREHLLEHGVHVARRARVSQPDIAVRGARRDAAKWRRRREVGVDRARVVQSRDGVQDLLAARRRQRRRLAGDIRAEMRAEIAGGGEVLRGGAPRGEAREQRERRAARRRSRARRREVRFRDAHVGDAQPEPRGERRVLQVVLGARLFFARLFLRLRRAAAQLDACVQQRGLRRAQQRRSLGEEAPVHERAREPRDGAVHFRARRRRGVASVEPLEEREQSLQAGE